MMKRLATSNFGLKGIQNQFMFCSIWSTFFVNFINQFIVMQIQSINWRLLVLVLVFKFVDVEEDVIDVRVLVREAFLVLVTLNVKLGGIQIKARSEDVIIYTAITHQLQVDFLTQTLFSWPFVVCTVALVFCFFWALHVN